MDLRTDLQAGVDFTAVVVRLVGDPGSPPLETFEAPAFPSEPWITGVRVHSFESLAPGEYQVQTELRNAAGEIAASRLLLVSVQAPKAMTVLITTTCTGVVCPGSADPPGAVACHGGQCVLPECMPESPEACPEPECTSDADCDSRAVCGEGTCAAELCWFAPGPAACPADQVCRPEIGCAMCDSSGCVPVAPPGCDPGLADCDGDLTNGCEIDITTATDCGGCGIECRGSTRTCCAGVCERSCP